MLRASRKVLKAGGRTAFFTIVVAPGLSESDHRLAVRLGPTAITMRRPIDEVMRQAGFTDIEVTDLTADFLATARAWVAESEAHADELRALLGDELDERLSDSRDKVRGAEEGLLQRLLVTATTPR